MSIWITSDNHYFHKSIMKFCPQTRPFADVEDMNHTMIENHNAVVEPNHTVYFLGDFSFGNAEQTKLVLSRLNGQKHLIYGNHDKVIRGDVSIQKMFVTVQEYKEITWNTHKFVLFHYPMRQWNGMHYGSFHCFGHVHGSLDTEVHGRSMDVGIDTRFGCFPYNIEEVARILEKRPILQHHGD